MNDYKWRIAGLLAIAMMVNIIDRNVMSFVMVDTSFKRIVLDIHQWTDADSPRFREIMSLVDMAFKIAYTLGFVVFGWLIDRLGVNRGFRLAVVIWSLSALAHSFVRGVWGLAAVRFTLGVGEAGGLPAAVKAIAEWFPKAERSFATGLLNAGVNLGVMATALLVPFLIRTYSWQTAFLLTGSLGLLVLYLWHLIYRPNTQVDVSSKAASAIRWRTLLTFRQTWAFAVGKFLTDPIWWFYLAWLPTYFSDSAQFGQRLDLKNMTGPFLIIYLSSDIGAVFFGWLATFLQRKGWSLNRARKTTMLLAGLCVVPVFGLSQTNSLPIAIFLLSLAATGHQGWSTNLYTLPSDLFPQRVVASVSGIGAMCGGIGGIILAGSTGFIINRFGYIPLFILASCSYVLALGLIHWLVPQFKSFDETALAPIPLTQ